MVVEAPQEATGRGGDRGGARDARRRRSRRRGALLLAAVALVGAGCGDDDDDATGAAASGVTSGGGGEGGGLSPASLAGRTFLSTEVTGTTLVPDTRVTIGFDDAHLGATAGCNTVSGGFALEDGVLRAPGLATTRMACPAELEQQDAWLAALLSSEPGVTLDGDVLTVEGDGGTLVLADRTTLVEPADVDGVAATTWAITGLSGPDGTVSAPEGASLTFGDGIVSVATGCNRGVGEVTVDGDVVTVGRLATTLAACTEHADWEAALLTLLDGELTWSRDGDGLVLTRGDGTLRLDPLR